MSEKKLHLDLRNHLILNKVPLVFIDFEESSIGQKYDGSSYSENYQILVLKKPNDHVLEVEPLVWPYAAKKVLLVYSLATKRIATIPLEFCFSVEDGVEKEFYFSNYVDLEQRDDHIMLVARGKDEDDHYCANVAIFATTGELVGVWQTDNVNGYKMCIRDFSDIGNGRWLVNFEIQEREPNKPAVHRLCLMTAGKYKVNTLFLEERWDPFSGSLLDAKTTEVRSWFSAEQVDGNPAFFALACFRQCCVYRYQTSPDEAKYRRYEKIADIALDNLHIKDIVVKLTEDRVVVSLFNSKNLTKPGSFYFEFDRNPS